MGIRSFLRGSLPSFYSAEVLLPLINLEKGLPKTAEEWDSCCLQSSVDVVFVEQWRRSMGVGGGRLTSPLAPCTVHPIFRGVVNNHRAALCRHGRSWSPPCWGSMDGMPSSDLIFSFNTRTC
jgi:hypothetical protein